MISGRFKKEPFTKMHSGYVEAIGIVHNHEINNDHYHPKRIRNGVIPGMQRKGAQ